MSSIEEQVQWFTDILDRIRYIEDALSDDTAAALEDEQTLAAVSYWFIVIGEASTRLRGDAERLVPGQDWRAVRGFGNMLKHQYERNDVRFISDVVADGALAELRSSCELAIQKIVHRRL